MTPPDLSVEPVEPVDRVDRLPAARVLPAILAVLGVIAVLTAVVDVTAGPWHGIRALTTAVFLILGPGWALAGFLVARSMAERVVVAAGAGVALSILVGQTMVVTRAWHPVGALYVAAAVAVPLLVRHALGPHRTGRRTEA